jgi:hypothetical protein
VAFYFSPLYLRLMERAYKVYWTITFLVMSVFAAPISSAKASGDLLHLAFAYTFALYVCCIAAFAACVAECAWFASNSLLAPSNMLFLLKLIRWLWTKH